MSAVDTTYILEAVAPSSSQEKSKDHLRLRTLKTRNTAPHAVLIERQWGTDLRCTHQVIQEEEGYHPLHEKAKAKPKSIKMAIQEILEEWREPEISLEVLHKMVCDRAGYKELVSVRNDVIKLSKTGLFEMADGNHWERIRIKGSPS